MTAGFEGAGACGALLGGWITDRYLNGRASRVCGVYMLLCAISIWAFWKLAGQSKIANTALLCTTGFLVYGPQCLLAALVANLASKRAAATAIGLTGIFGYASKGISGWGIGMLVEHRGWDRAFESLIAVAIVATIIFALTWNARATEQTPG
jgi:sugar phosphate permease